MSPSQAISFLVDLMVAGHRLTMEMASGGEVLISCSVPRATWTAEGEDFSSAVEDLKRFIYGRLNK